MVPVRGGQESLTRAHAQPRSSGDCLRYRKNFILGFSLDSFAWISILLAVIERSLHRYAAVQHDAQPARLGSAMFADCSLIGWPRRSATGS